MITLIKNAFPVFESHVSEIPVSLCMKDGIITDCDFKGAAPVGAAVIDADYGYVMPGFIDLHIHGGGGADFMDAEVSSFKTVVETHLQHGTTAMIPTSMTASEKEITDFINCYKSFLKEPNHGAKTLGLHLEGPYLSGGSKTSKGAQRVDFLRTPDKQEIERLLAVAEGHIVRWDAAPELDGADMFVDMMKKNNIIASVAHSGAVGSEATWAFQSGFNHVTHFYNAVPGYRKIDQTVYAGVVEAAYLHDHVAVEMIADGRHIPKECMQLALKIKGARNVAAITDAMRIAGTDMKSGYLGNTISGSEVTVDDTVAKLKDLSSYAGSICTMDRALRVLHLNYEIPLNTVSTMMSYAPAKLLGLENKMGSIAFGKAADFVIVDREMKINQVIKDGLPI